MDRDMMSPGARRAYLEALRRLTPEQRLTKAFELSALTRELFETGLRRRHPELSAEDFDKLLRERLDKCHNRNW